MKASFVAANSSVSNLTGQKIIHEGANVLVRVISDKGNGKYEASVAGNRLMLLSRNSLKPGQTFVGTISLKDGQIQISRGNEILASNPVETLSLKDMGSLFSPVSSQAASSLLASLNLPQDIFSLNILKSFQQLGLNFDSQILKLVRRLSEKSKNPERTMEKLVMLFQKGFDLSTISLEELDELTGEDADLEKETSHGEDSALRAYNQNDQLNSFTSFKSFVDGILKMQFSEEKWGKLTVSNHLGFKKDAWSENSWVLIPFTVEDMNDLTVKGSGKISLLMGSSDKSLKKLNVTFNYSEEKWIFVIFMKERKPAKILFSNDDKNAEEIILLKKLSEKVSCPVFWKPYEELSIIGAETESLTILGKGGYA